MIEVILKGRGMNKDSFVFRRDWFLALDGLESSVRLEVYDAILHLVFNGEEPNLSPIANTAMRFITPQIERDRERYNTICEQRKSFGRKGGVAKATKSYQKLANVSKGKQEVASVADNDIQDTNVSMSISNNKKEKDTHVSKKTKEVDTLFEECWKAYRRKGSKKESLEVWKKLTDAEKRVIPSHIKSYVSTRELQYQKDFQRYLSHKIFNTVVFQGNQAVYDPDIFSDSNEYKPITDGDHQWWNEKRHCLMFNGYIHMLNDGYTAETRPDGAKIAWNMYEWTWSKEQKEWIKHE